MTLREAGTTLADLRVLACKWPHGEMRIVYQSLLNHGAWIVGTVIIEQEPVPAGPSHCRACVASFHALP